MHNTHKAIDPSLSGKVVEFSNGYAKVELKTTSQMLADSKGLIHGGFTFSAADYCAMVAINKPNVVLVGADVKFLAPTKLEDTVIFEAKVLEQECPKAKVEVVGKVEDKEVFKGIFKTYTTKEHILK
jgi:acyl-coenzyme A thioesterase PaaI-like protein